MLIANRNEAESWWNSTSAQGKTRISALLLKQGGCDENNEGRIIFHHSELKGDSNVRELFQAVWWRMLVNQSATIDVLEGFTVAIGELKISFKLWGREEALSYELSFEFDLGRWSSAGCQFVAVIHKNWCCLLYSKNEFMVLFHDQTK